MSASNLGYDGNSETTAITNAAAGEKGWPARTVDDQLVFVVLHDSAPPTYENVETGALYQPDAHGRLVPTTEEEA